MLEQLREDVFRANMMLTIFVTFGVVKLILRDQINIFDL